MAMLRISLAIMIAAGCATTPSQGSLRDCQERCAPYKPENEGGWSGLLKQIDTDGTKYKRCMDTCRGRIR